MIDTQSVFELLPAVYRLRDADGGGPLEALVSILADQADVVDLDIESLYDNWFVETCDAWLIPYLGDLLAVRPVYPIAGAVSQRSYVANTIRYRRRKGTVSVLEGLAADVTGWPAKAVEFFQLLETTQYANHLRLQNLRTPDLRDADGLELLGGPFERAAHTAEVRRIGSRRGRYNIPNVGLHLWRLSSYPLGLDDVDDGTAATARATPGKLGDVHTFNPLGLDAPLFNDPSNVLDVAQRVQEEDVPALLRRRALFDELEGVRRASLGWPATRARFFTKRRHAVRVWTQATPAGPWVEVSEERILVADLSLGQLPPSTKDYPKPQGGADVSLPIDVAIDPRVGRLTFPSGATPNAVEVAYAYGFPADIGGGPYERRSDLLEQFVDVKRPPSVVFGVGRDTALVQGTNFPTLAAAVQAWNLEPAGTVGVIVVFDSRTYSETLTGVSQVKVPEQSSLLILGGERPDNTADAFAASGVRPHLKGDIHVIGTAPDKEAPGHLQIDGLLIEGSVTVRAGNLGTLRLSNCAIAPRTVGDAPGPSPRRLVAEPSPKLERLIEARRIELVRTIVGPVSLADDRYALVVDASVLDGTGGPAIDAAQAEVTLSGATVFGDLQAKTLEAENSIFDGIVVAARTQSGCVRFSFVPADPACRTPRRYRCQPELALADVSGAAAKAAVVARVKPAYNSRDYGNPAYAQLDLRCAREIRTGAEDGSEMGVFTIVKQPQREANLEVALGEYLPFGLEAGWFYVT
jgi:Phage tail protein (Tail_P2_I)